jgi:glycosyltransferase involved in cell wall biosynthesis
MQFSSLNTNSIESPTIQKSNTGKNQQIDVPEILFITTYTPRECGIATYSEDLINSIEAKYQDSFKINICPIVNSKDELDEYLNFPIKLELFLTDGFDLLVKQINENKKIQTIMIQHEFGLFYQNETHFRSFLHKLNKPIIVVFHTVLPKPNTHLLNQVKEISGITKSIIVMTKSSADILVEDYDIERKKINIIQHGTHLVPHVEKEALKTKYNLEGKLVLSTFGFISSGKSIETTLYAMPMIIEDFPNIKFLIIGKTHPSVLLNEGNAYREKLENIVAELKIGPFVTFINAFLPLPELLEYLQLTDVYLFTSKERRNGYFFSNNRIKN